MKNKSHWLAFSLASALCACGAAVAFWLVSRGPAPVPRELPAPDSASAAASIPARPLEASLSSEVQLALGKTGDGRYATRVRALKSLHAPLPAEEAAALGGYLFEPLPSRGMAAEESRAVADLVMTLLRECDEVKAVATFTGVFNAKAVDEVYRDYAVQHLSFCAAAAPQEEPQVRVFFDALKETRSSIAGTALLALGRLSEAHGQPGRDAVADAALAMLRDPGCGPLARTSAVQTCASLPVAEALPPIRALAADATSIPLRAAAIAALGALGDSSDFALLDACAAGPEHYLHPAARTAIARLNLPRSPSSTQ